MLRVAEFAALFFGVPSLFAFTRHRFSALPTLWVFAACSMAVLLHDPKMNHDALWNAAALPRNLASVLLPFCLAALVLLLAVHHFAPTVFLSLPRTNPMLFAAILMLYPVFSVYPQGVVYRAFLCHRYSGIFGSGWGIVVASAVAFGYLHIVFRNAWAVGLSVLAGLLFAVRYQVTGSLFVSAFEHTLYGYLIFTSGLGRYFYSGNVRRA